MRRKAAQLQRIDGIISRALKKMHVPFRPEDRRLVEIWEEAVGPQIAAQSRPDGLRRGTLFVKVSNSVWMQQLHFLKEEITGKVNDIMGRADLKDIRFSIGQVPAPAGKEENTGATPPAAPLRERDEKMIETCLASLADEELRIVIKRVMTKEITLRRGREKKVP